MLFAAPMASLAIDSFRQARESGGRAWIVVVRLRNLRIRIVAEHAIVGDSPPEPQMIGAIIARIHSPIPSFLGVPGERQLDERAVGVVMQVGSHVVSGSDNEVNLLFSEVVLFAVEPDLILALIITSVPLDHGEVRVGGRMIKSVFVGIVLDPILGPGAIKRTPHASAAVALPNLGMASGTGLRI